MKIFTCLIVSLASIATLAAVSPAQKMAPTSPVLKGEGMTFGGVAGSGFTLTDLRRTSDAKKKVERVVIDIGDRNGSPWLGRPGYYFAELKKNPQRLVLDFAQMPSSRMDQAKISEQMRGSLAVKRTTMSLDPMDSSLNLTMDLKSNAKARVYQVPGAKGTSKVVIDFFVE